MTNSPYVRSEDFLSPCAVLTILSIEATLVEAG